MFMKWFKLVGVRFEYHTNITVMKYGKDYMLWIQVRTCNN